jgi:hypothetical protein
MEAATPTNDGLTYCLSMYCAKYLPIGNVTGSPTLDNKKALLIRITGLNFWF